MKHLKNLTFALALVAFLPTIGWTQEAVPAEEAVAEVELTPAEKQKKAGELFQEAKVLAEAKDFGGAIQKFDDAFDAFPDPGLKFLRGETYQLWGNQEVELGNEVGGYDHIDHAIKSYEDYLSLAPDPSAMEEGSPAREAAEANKAKAEKRIADLKSALTRYEENKEREKSQKEAEEEAERQALEEEQAAIRARSEGMQKSLDVVVYGGADKSASAVARAMIGGALNWNGLGVDAHLGLDGFLRFSDSKGINARSLTLLDLGVRYGLKPRSVGPFVAAGGSFGIIAGRPRDIRLVDKPNTCSSLGSNDCNIEIDKNISIRGGLGYGFESSESTTVALRLDLQYWLFSVASNQPSGSPVAARIELPQSTIAFLVGIEFMLWK